MLDRKIKTPDAQTQCNPIRPVCAASVVFGPEAIAERSCRACWLGNQVQGPCGYEKYV
nr:MAG TPA: hypothetical protein [Caudoviricetes sp.]